MNKHNAFFKRLTNNRFKYCFFLIIVLYNPSIYSQNIIPKSHNASIDTTKQQGKSIQEYLKKNSQDSYIYKKLYEWLVISEDSGVTSSEILYDSETEYKKYNYKLIRNIKIKQVSPFVKNIIDTLNFSTNQLEKNLSKIRFETKESIIKNNLTFKKGEFINSQNLKDSERILRSLAFITEALIVVEPALLDTSFVDVFVITQDTYPYGVDLSGGSNTNFSIYSKNMLGYGLEMSHTFYTQPSNNHNFGIHESLKWKNIYGTYLTLKTEYANYGDLNQYKFGVEKDFFVPEIKYAGGISILRNLKIENPVIDSTKNWVNNYDYLYQDYWFGRAFLINAPNFFNRSNINIIGQSLLTRYYHMPDSTNKLFKYKPNIFLFTSLSFSKREYYKNNLIYNYGRTEDVPYGFLTSVSFGYNYNQLKTRYYVGGHFSVGEALIQNKGYLYFSGDYRSFFYHGKPEETTINLHTKYISSLIPLKRQQWRSFISINYVKGFNQPQDNYIYVNNKNNGLRAYNSYNLKGKQKMVISTENILFTAGQTLGFKAALFTFYDMAWITSDNHIFKRKPYYSIGAGFRIRNDKLVINTIQFQLAYFPRIPPGGIEYNFRLSGEQVNTFNQFDPQKPYEDVYK